MEQNSKSLKKYGKWMVFQITKGVPDKKGYYSIKERAEVLTAYRSISVLIACDHLRVAKLF